MKDKGKRRRPDRPKPSLLEVLKRIFRRKPEPEDPYAYRTAPLRHPPHGRSGAAVAELDEK